MPPKKATRQNRGDGDDSENSVASTNRRRSTGISRQVTKGNRRSVASSTALHGGPVHMRSVSTQTTMRRSTRSKKPSRYLNADEFTSLLPKQSKGKITETSQTVMPKSPRGRPRKKASTLKVKIIPVKRKNAQTHTEAASQVSMSPRRTRSQSRSESSSKSRTPSKSQIDEFQTPFTPNSSGKRTPKRQPYILSTSLVERSSFVQVTPKTATKRNRQSTSTNERSSTKRTRRSSSSNDSSKSRRITPKTKIIPQTPKTPTTNRTRSRIPLSAKRTSDSEEQKFFFSDIDDTTLINTKTVESPDSTIKARGRKPKSLNTSILKPTVSESKLKAKNSRMSRSMGETPHKSMITPLVPKEQKSNSSIVIKKLKPQPSASSSATKPIVLDDRFVTIRRGHPSHESRRSKRKSPKLIETSS